MTRRAHDHYPTPENTARVALQWALFLRPKHVLDPCAGGHFDVGADGGVVPVQGTYSRLLREMADDDVRITTLDIRPDAPVLFHGVDFLQWRPAPGEEPDLVVSNPPYSLAQAFVEHALTNVVAPEGTVMFLLRLGFLASQKRAEWIRKFRPAVVHVHSTRPSFTGDGASDTSDYAHVEWRNCQQPKGFTELRWFP